MKALRRGAKPEHQAGQTARKSKLLLIGCLLISAAACGQVDTHPDAGNAPAVASPPEETRRKVFWPGGAAGGALPVYNTGCGAAAPLALYEPPDGGTGLVLACAGAALIESGSDVYLTILYKPSAGLPETKHPEKPDETRPEQETRQAGSFSDFPLPAGRGRVGDWLLSVGQHNLDAWDQLSDQDSFNTAPGDGRRYVLVYVTAVHLGETAGAAHPLHSLRLGAVGGSRRFYDSADERCGIIPNPLFWEPHVLPGGKISGNVCFDVSEQDAVGLVLYAEPFDGSGRGLWLSIEPDRTDGGPGRGNTQAP